MVTSNQVAVLNFIGKYIRANSISPSMSEIAAGTGISKSSLTYILNKLDKDGYIVYRHGRQRGISLPQQQPVQDIVNLKEQARKELADSGLSVEQSLIHCLLQLDKIRGNTRSMICDYFFEGAPLQPEVIREDIIAQLRRLSMIACLSGVDLNIYVDDIAEAQDELEDLGDIAGVA
jgi:SOS-response transcriptional repressor LexA